MCQCHAILIIIIAFPSLKKNEDMKAYKRDKWLAQGVFTNKMSEPGFDPWLPCD
jgi:hypothetical protein